MTEPAVRIEDDVQELNAVQVRPLPESTVVIAAEAGDLVENRIFLLRMLREPLRQGDAGSKFHRPSVEGAQQLAFDLDELDALILGEGPLLVDLIDLQRDRSAFRRVQLQTDRQAVAIALGMGEAD